MVFIYVFFFQLKIYLVRLNTLISHHWVVDIAGTNSRRSVYKLGKHRSRPF